MLLSQYVAGFNEMEFFQGAVNVKVVKVWLFVKPAASLCTYKKAIK